MKYIIFLHCIAFTVNILFGYLRRSKKKFSAPWFIYIHLSIPVIIPLRLWWHIHPGFIPLLITTAIMGQLVGSRLIPNLLLRGKDEKITRC